MVTEEVMVVVLLLKLTQANTKNRNHIVKYNIITIQEFLGCFLLYIDILFMFFIFK
jgi:hypothetical protein